MLTQFTRGLASKYVAHTHHNHTTNETALNDATPNTQKRPVNSLQAALNDFAYVSMYQAKEPPTIKPSSMRSVG